MNMKNKKKFKIWISILSIMILFPVIVNARYFEKLENFEGRGTIAEPIFKVEKLQDTINTTINKESGIQEYIFKIKNFVLEDDGISKRISQVDMIYNIEIINEKENFPVRYELYELDTDQNLLNENGIIKDIVINKNIEYEKNYRLVVFWENKDGILENTDNIKIIINSSQLK